MATQPADLSQLPMRYAPTLSLAVPDSAAGGRLSRTAIVAGKLLPREDDALTQRAASSVGRACAGADDPAASSRRRRPASSLRHSIGWL